MGNLRSPVEIARSAWEFLVRAILSWWTLIVGVLAGIAYLLEHAAKIQISNNLWLRIVIGGAVVSLVWAYHRARMERDAAHAHEVRADHLAELQHRLGVLLSNVQAGGGCDYEDIAYSTTNQATFKAHYRDLEALLDEWDATVAEVVTLKRSITTALEEAAETTDESRPWFGLNGDKYDTARVRALIQEAVERRSSEGTLEMPIVLNWTETPPFPPLVSYDEALAFWKLEIVGNHVATVLDLPTENRAERIAATKRRVEELWKAAMGLEAPKDLRIARTRLTGLQQDLQTMLVDWKKATGIRVMPGCSICRKNEGWPEPKPPLWRRVADRIQHTFSRIFM